MTKIFTIWMASLNGRFPLDHFWHGVQKYRAILAGTLGPSEIIVKKNDEKFTFNLKPLFIETVSWRTHEIEDI